MQADTTTPKGSYYTVNIQVGQYKLPYTVFAHSDYEAAHKVHEEIGYLVDQKDVDGPYQVQ